MPECTKAEREYLDIKFSPNPLSRAPALLDAASAVRAERRAAEQGGNVAYTPIQYRESVVDRLLAQLTARIAELESALAEERDKPKEGAVRFEAQAMVASSSFEVLSSRLEWRGDGRHSKFYVPDAERHAREHAARLQAEHDAKGVTG